MRKEIMYYVTRMQAIEMMPWAVIVVAVDHGYMGFESDSDYFIWRNQK